MSHIRGGQLHLRKPMPALDSESILLGVSGGILLALAFQAAFAISCQTRTAPVSSAVTTPRVSRGSRDSNESVNEDEPILRSSGARVASVYSSRAAYCVPLALACIAAATGLYLHFSASPSSSSAAAVARVPGAASAPSSSPPALVRASAPATKQAMHDMTTTITASTPIAATASKAAAWAAAATGEAEEQAAAAQSKRDLHLRRVAMAAAARREKRCTPTTTPGPCRVVVLPAGLTCNSSLSFVTTPAACERAVAALNASGGPLPTLNVRLVQSSKRYNYGCSRCTAGCSAQDAGHLFVNTNERMRGRANWRHEAVCWAPTRRGGGGSRHGQAPT